MKNISENTNECGFAERLIAYVYDEADAADKAAFQSHLRHCAECKDEVAEFSGISFSMKEWKSAEFDGLPTPFIDIPYKTKDPVVEVATTNGSWLSAIRGLFTLSPSWSLATASMAVIVVAVGLVLFSMRSGTDSELAEKNKNTKVTAPTETPVANSSPVAKPENKKAVPVQPDQTDVAKDEKPENDSPRVVKIANAPRTAPVKSDRTKPANQKRTPKTDSDTETAVDTDEEDDSLRLSELFDEIDTD